jgi:hypothetical protein
LARDLVDRGRQAGSHTRRTGRRRPTSP